MEARNVRRGFVCFFCSNDESRPIISLDKGVYIHDDTYGRTRAFYDGAIRLSTLSHIIEQSHFQRLRLVLLTLQKTAVASS